MLSKALESWCVEISAEIILAYALGLRVILADVLQTLNANVSDLQRDARGPTGHMDGDASLAAPVRSNPIGFIMNPGVCLGWLYLLGRQSIISASESIRLLDPDPISNSTIGTIRDGLSYAYIRTATIAEIDSVDVAEYDALRKIRKAAG